jgi:hypothetical protein
VRFPAGVTGVAAAILVIGVTAIPVAQAAGVAGGHAATTATTATSAGAGPATAPGTTLYVDFKGACSDSGPGTQADPFCTVQAAANVVDPGQTVDITASTTADDPQSVTITRSGTPSEPITFAWSGIGIDPLLSPQKQTGKAVVTLDDVQDVTLSRLDIGGLGTDDAVDVIGSSGISLANLEISHGTTGSPAPPPESADILIDGASFDVSVSRTFFASGASLEEVLAEPGARQVTLTDNVLSAASATSGFTLDGTTDAAVTANTLMVDCSSGAVARTLVTLADGSSGAVENNVLEPLAASGCTAPTVGLSVDASSADSAGGVTADYNAFFSEGSAVDYSWAGASYSDPAAFTTATGQGAHDLTLAKPFYRVPPEGSPAIDSGNCSAPGEPSTDWVGDPWLRDPLATDAGLGNGSCYASRGAFAAQDTLPLTFTAPALNSAGYPAGAVPFTTGLTITGNATSAWGEPVSYTVDFGDGSSPAPSTPGTALTHTYPTAGQYTITISATDTSGMTASEALTPVDALPDQAPAAGLSAAPDGLNSSIGILPDTADFTASPSSFGWEVANDDISYGGAGEQSLPSNPGATWRYTYAAPGTHTATLTVTDKLGRKTAAKATITVGDEPQSVSPTADYDHSVAAHAVVKIPLSKLDENDCCARAALVNVIVTNAKGSGYVTMYPDGTTRPGLPTVQFLAGRPAENSALATGGTVDFYNGSPGTINIEVVTYGIDTIMTTDGYGSYGETYSPVTPASVLPLTRIAGGHQISFRVAGRDQVPVNAQDVVLDITALGGSTAGDVLVSPAGKDGDLSSKPAGYWAKGQQVTNLAMQSLGNGLATVENAGEGAVYFSVSVVGYYLYTGSDSVFVPATPTRLDSVTIGAKQSVALAVTGRNGIPATGTTAVAVNLTAAHETASGTVTAYADGTTLPAPVNLSYASGATIANAAIVAVGGDGAIRLYNGGSKPVIVDVDLTGSYYAYP